MERIIHEHSERQIFVSQLIFFENENRLPTLATILFSFFKVSTNRQTKEVFRMLTVAIGTASLLVCTIFFRDGSQIEFFTNRKNVLRCQDTKKNFKTFLDSAKPLPKFNNPI